MIITDKLCLDDFRDVKEALVMQDPIDVVSTFWMLCPSLLVLFVFGLQFV